MQFVVQKSSLNYLSFSVFNKQVLKIFFEKKNVNPFL